MPRLSVWFVRASLMYLAVGFVLGALMLAEKGIPFYAGIWSILPVHIEFLLMGWLVQLAMGVAFWILPRFGAGPPRGDERLILAAWIFLNLGIVLSTLQLWRPAFLAAGRMIELIGVAVYVVGVWRRVKPAGA